MTFDELERWLVLMFAQYHQEIHGGINTTPRAKWREGIIGTEKILGRGLPPRRTDEEKVRLDFMPCIERTVQQYGVLWDVNYWHDALRPWIGALDPKNKKLKRQFVFRRDPRDISQIYFFEPDEKRYYAVPYQDTSFPPASIWEWREAKAQLKAEGAVEVDQREIFALITRRRQILDDAAAKTKMARREKQRRIHHENSRTEREARLPTVSNPTPTAAPPAIRGYNPDEVTAYEDEY